MTILSEAKKINFGLRDYDKTKSKYQNLNKYDEELKKELVFMYGFGDYLENEIWSSNMFLYNGWLKQKIDNAFKTDKKVKASLRYLKTLTNNIAFDINTKLLANNLGLEESTAKKYATRYYLLHYKKINSEMKKAYLEIVKTLINENK